MLAPPSKILLTYPMMIVVIVVVSIALPLLFAWRILWNARKNSKLRKQGALGKGTVAGIRATGTEINNQPVCEILITVELPGQPPYQATASQVVPLTELSSLQQGAVVTVRVNLAAPSDIVVVGLGFVEITQEEAQTMIATSQELLARLNEMGGGISAMAIVREFKPTGVTVNGTNPLAEVLVRVMPDGGVPFDATVVGVFGDAGLHKYQAGQEVQVRFDAEDRNSVTFDTTVTAIAEAPLAG